MPGSNDNILDSIKGTKFDKDIPMKKMIFLDNAPVPLMHLKNLQQDIELPDYMTEFLKLESISLTLWDMFKRHPKFNHKERLVCVVSGVERFRIVSSIFKQNMYSGIFDDIESDWTPINLFERDPYLLHKYKMMKVSDVYQADLR
jgi:hypothetical protein